MRDRVLDFLSERGTLADEQAVEYLLTQADPLGAADRVLRAFPDPPFALTLEDIHRAVGIARAASERALPGPPAAPRAPPPPRAVPARVRGTVSAPPPGPE